MNNLPVPRCTAFWRRQNHLVIDAIRQACLDPDLRGPWQALAAIRAERAGIELVYRNSQDKERADRIRDLTNDEPDTILAVLVPLVTSRAPALAHAYGPFLSIFIIAIADLYSGRENPILSRLFRFLPDNPIELQPDGDLRHSSEATPAHLLEVAEYHRSFRPEGKRGRAPGQVRAESAHDPATSERAGDARKALAMSRAKCHWVAIAEGLGWTWDRYDGKATERIRQRVLRLIERGRLDESRESRRTP